MHPTTTTTCDVVVVQRPAFVVPAASHVAPHLSPRSVPSLLPPYHSLSLSFDQIPPYRYPASMRPYSEIFCPLLPHLVPACHRHRHRHGLVAATAAVAAAAAAATRKSHNKPVDFSPATPYTPYTSCVRRIGVFEGSTSDPHHTPRIDAHRTRQHTEVRFVLVSRALPGLPTSLR